MKKMCPIHDHCALLDETAHGWFYSSHSIKFGVKDVFRSGQPLTKKIEGIIVKIENDQHCYMYY